VSTPLPRHQFPVTQQHVYLNHAAVGPLPASSVTAIEAFVAAQASRGVLGTWPYDARMPEYRQRIGAFIGASGDEIAILGSTSGTANAVAQGIDWRDGDEVLLCDNEFPSNAIPWLALRERGVAVRLIATAGQRLTPDVLRAHLSPKTRAVTVSWVSYADGYRHDLASLSEVTHDAGALLCVDAIQGLGAFPVDVRACGVDAFYGGAGKWMLGLHGTAFLYVERSLIDRWSLATPGWRSMRDMWDFHNYDQPYAPQALRFEGGTPNFLGTLALVEAIALFERCGKDAVASHVLSLTDRLYEGLLGAGADVATLR
jgi:cysteine desulfurase/selenocysteine lyase